MNLFSLENLLITIFCLTLAFFIAKYAENKAHRLWAFFNCAVAIWSFATFMVGISKKPEQALFYWKIAYFGVIFISILFYHFVCAYYELNKKIFLIILYLQGLIYTSITLFTNLLINNIYLAFNSIYYNKENLSFNIWFILWTITVFLAFLEFGIHLKTDNSRRIPSLIMFWAILIGFIGGTSTTLPMYGIMIYPKYQISICLYVFIIAYGIFYHRLLPINIVIRRSIIYSLLVATISLTYLLSVLISQHIFHQYFGYSSTIIGSVIIAIAFIPIKNKIQNFIDRFFLKATPIEMAQQNEQLRQEVTHSERMKSIAIFASGMAHEIKNPLTPIKTFSELLPSRLDDKEFLLKFSKIINREVDRIDSLVQELLSFAKPSSPQLKQVNIHQLIGQTLDLLNNETIRHKINLNTSFENKNVLINIDPQQIKQAFLNIFLNAIEAMPNSGTINIRTIVITKPFSDVIASEAKRSLIIEISDTGCGIAPKDLPHIFDPFFSKKDHGTGLGLSITHEIINNHNGKIVAESELGKGTTFKIELPLQNSPL